MSVSILHIGLDLDGTLVDYDALFLRLAVEAGLVPPDTRASKAVIRHEARRHGDRTWQGLQALAYGERMAEARLFEGALEALAQWTREGHHLSIVSHKSRYTDLLGEKGPDLHDHARRCLRQWGILDLIPEEHIHFCPTRQHKCLQIARLGCQFFVDDLPEVFAHVDFPSTVCSILFAPEENPAETPAVTPADTRGWPKDWPEDWPDGWPEGWTDGRKSESGARPMVCQSWRQVQQAIVQRDVGHA